MTSQKHHLSRLHDLDNIYIDLGRYRKYKLVNYSSYHIIVRVCHFLGCDVAKNKNAYIIIE